MRRTFWLSNFRSSKLEILKRIWCFPESVQTWPDPSWKVFHRFWPTALHYSKGHDLSRVYAKYWGVRFPGIVFLRPHESPPISAYCLLTMLFGGVCFSALQSLCHSPTACEGWYLHRTRSPGAKNAALAFPLTSSPRHKPWCSVHSRFVFLHSRLSSCIHDCLPAFLPCRWKNHPPMRLRP